MKYKDKKYPSECKLKTSQCWGEKFTNEAVFGSSNNEIYNLTVAVRTVKLKTKKFVSHFITRVGDFENFDTVTSALAKH